MKYQIDIETLSTASKAVVMSVAICNTDGYGDQIFLPLPVQLTKGRVISPDVLAWWSERPEQYAKILADCKEAEENAIAISTVHTWVRQYFANHDDDETREVWMNPPAFDGVILQSLFADFDFSPPWHYRNLRDFRTLKNLALLKNPEIQMPKKPENLHDALVDCRWQMMQTHIYLTELGI